MPKTDESSDNSELDDASKIQSVVENANAEDEKDLSANEDQDNEELDEEESNDQDDASDEDDSEEENSDDEDEDEEDKSKKKESAERKFKNLASDDDKEYISNIEKAYENSTAEALRLNTELGNATRRINALMQAVGSDPALAESLNKAMVGQPSSGDDSKGDDSPSPTDNPFLTNAQTEWRQKSAKEVQEILDANPELLSDPETNKEVRHWMEVFSAEEYKNNKRLMTGGEAMEAAMRYLGVQDKRKKQEVASAAKNLAAPTRPQSSKKPKSSTSKGVSDAAYKFGELMGVSKESVEKYAQQ